MLRAFQVARVAADPPPHERAARPGGWPDFAYYRLHGTPRIYYSAYDDETLAALARQLAPPRPPSAVWCIFDNTAAGAAIGNALRSSVSCSPSSRWMPREPVAAPYG